VLDDIGADGRREVEREVERLQAWLAGTVVIPRFPTPLYEQLRGRHRMP
jgi:hypothetical protein